MTAMRFHADLHVHSKYSRATSRDLDLEHLAAWAARKGIGVVATGDFTHPVWRAELKDKLVPAEPGLFRLRDDIAAGVAATPAAMSSRRRNNPGSVGTSLSLSSARQTGWVKSPVATTPIPLRAAHAARCSRSRSRLVARECFE